MRQAVRDLVTAAWNRALAEGRVSPTALPPAAVDFETFYRSEKLAKKQGLSPCTVDLSGNWGYCRHPEWEAYMVSIYSPAHPALGLPEICYSGPVENAPWFEIARRTWVSHNRNFDKHVYLRCVELGLVPPVFMVATKDDPTRLVDAKELFSEWHDTADLAVYCHFPRALAKVVTLVYKLALDKEARSSMDGVRWADVPEAEKPRILLYALEDSATCVAFWLDYQHQWPEEERFASVHTGEIEFRGIAVDVAQVDKDLATLETARWKAMTAIPWYDTEDENGKPVKLRSKKALDRECQKAGVPPPSSTSVKSKEFQEWLDEYGLLVPAVFALARFRSIDRALSVYRHLKARIRPDGRAALGLKYMGADKTGRWSGANKFNLQNLIKVPMVFIAGDYGWLYPIFDDERQNIVGGKNDDGLLYDILKCIVVDIRRCLIAGPGFKLVIPDLSQIEPRVLNWVVGNTGFLDYCRQGLSPYEAHAKDSGYEWEGKLKKTQPGMYALFKARVLALGYGAGWEKFIGMARGYCESEEQFLSVFAAEPAEGDEAKFLDYLQWLVTNLKHRASKAALETWPELDAQDRRIWVNSWRQVTDFRKGNPLIFHKETGLAPRLDRDFKASVNDGVFENELPSGRSLKYFDISPSYGWSAKQGNPMGIPTRLYGGKLVENLVQAIARDVFMLGVNRLERAGYRVLFHVHDEAIIEAPMDVDPEEIARLLSIPPDWAKTLPVASEYEVSAFYKK